MTSSSTPLTQFEPATPQDVPELVQLLRALFALEPDFGFDADKQARGLAALIAAPRARVLVARRGTQVLGMVTAQLVISTAEGAPSVWLEDVCVREDARGQGLGRALVEAALAWARAQGATRAQLLADRDNRAALDFYAASGWQTTRLGTLRRLL